MLRSDRREGKKFDLIVTDTDMPVMSGLEFLEEAYSSGVMTPSDDPNVTVVGGTSLAS